MPAEAISANAYTVGTASGIVVGMSADAQVAVIQNLEPANYSDAYARHGYNDVWLGGDVDNAIRVRGGETLTLPMIQGQTLSAVAQNDSKLGVLRQD